MSEKGLKERIRLGEVLIGVAVPLNASLNQMETIVSKDNYAFVTTDSQHAAFNEETLVTFCQKPGYAGTI